MEDIFIGNFPFGATEIVTFGVNEKGDTELMFSGGDLDIQLRKGPINDPDYNPFGEDAFAIANSYFQIIHYKMAGEPIPQSEGVSLGLASYFAYRYMTINGYNTSSKIFTHGEISANNDECVELDMEFSNDEIEEVYGSPLFSTAKKHRKSRNFYLPPYGS